MATVTGPIMLTAGQIFTETDPTSNSNSNRAQFQNFSGFQLTVSTPIGQYSLPPNTAATWPTDGGAPFTVTVGPVGLAGAGLYIQWLLNTDQQIVPDGPIPVPYVPPGYLVSSSTAEVNISCGDTGDAVLAAPAAGTLNVVTGICVWPATTAVEQLTVYTSPGAGIILFNGPVSITPTAKGDSSYPLAVTALDMTVAKAVVADLTSHGSGLIELTLQYRNVLTGP
jgi:hypothetical protein